MTAGVPALMGGEPYAPGRWYVGRSGARCALDACTDVQTLTESVDGE